MSARLTESAVRNAGRAAFEYGMRVSGDRQAACDFEWYVRLDLVDDEADQSDESVFVFEDDPRWTCGFHSHWVMFEKARAK